MRIILFFTALLVSTVAPLRIEAAPEYRGYQISRFISDDEIDQLKDEYKVNIVRIQVGDNFNMDGVTGDAYIDMMEGVFDQIDPLIAKLAAKNIKIVFAMYSPPGGFETRTAPSHYQMFSDASLQDDFIDMWLEIINRYGNNDAIYAFDLLNEPAMQKSKLGAGARTWNELLIDTIEAIREVAPTKLLMVKSLYGDPSKLTALPAINDENIIYSYHPYLFLAYQHSGIDQFSTNIPAPSYSRISTKLRGLLAKFYLKHYKYFLDGKVPTEIPLINAGEVAVSAAAKDSGEFLDNLLQALEDSAADKAYQRTFNTIKKKGKKLKKKKDALVYTDFFNMVRHQSWTVHAFDEATIWDPRYECTSIDDCDFAGTTDRDTVVKEYFSKN